MKDSQHTLEELLLELSGSVTAFIRALVFLDYAAIEELAQRHDELCRAVREQLEKIPLPQRPAHELTRGIARDLRLLHLLLDRSANLPSILRNCSPALT